MNITIEIRPTAKRIFFSPTVSLHCLRTWTVFRIVSVIIGEIISIYLSIILPVFYVLEILFLLFEEVLCFLQGLFFFSQLRFRDLTVLKILLRLRSILF